MAFDQPIEERERERESVTREILSDFDKDLLQSLGVKQFEARFGLRCSPLRDVLHMPQW